VGNCPAAALIYRIVDDDLFLSSNIWHSLVQQIPYQVALAITFKFCSTTTNNKLINPLMTSKINTKHYKLYPTLLYTGETNHILLMDVMVHLPNIASPRCRPDPHLAGGAIADEPTLLVLHHGLYHNDLGIGWYRSFFPESA
jgi:hypothetical protein